MTGFGCLAITALHVVQYERITYLMSGAGCSLAIREGKGEGNRLHEQPIFSCQTIHGITSCNLAGHGTGSSTWIIIWGGRLVRMGRFALQPGNTRSDSASIHLELEDSIDVEDWILDVCIDPTKSEALLLTAHNNLYKLPINTASSSNPDRLLSAICSGPQTLLYSGRVLLARKGHWLIASGTVFGEIVVWTCSQQEDLSWKMWIRHTFLGHQGSVFGVSLSDSFNWQGSSRRLLASCSDDRTIRIWNVSDCEQDIKETNATRMSLRDTGFGAQHGEKAHLAMAWGHLSRIWNICFEFHPDTDEDELLGLFSRGEDGVCQLWRLKLRELFAGDNTNAEILTEIFHDRHHAGKNVWSFAPAVLDNQCRLFSGGADGQIVARNFSLATRNSEHIKDISFQQILKAPLSNLLSLSDSYAMPSSLKQYIILQKGEIIATTDTGDVLSGSIYASRQWSVIHPGAYGKAITMSVNRGGDHIFFSELDGSLLAYNVVSQEIIRYTDLLPAQLIWMEVVYNSNKIQGEPDTFCLLSNMYRKVPQFLTVKHTETGTQINQTAINLPPGFLITTSFYHPKRKILVCGSRTGALAVFQGVSEESAEASNPHIRWHVHGSDTITSIIEAPKSRDFKDIGILYIVSTGRDGTLAFHRITTNTDSSNLHIVHRSNPPIGRYIEGARFSPMSNGDYALIVHGFKSKEFVVWDESNQVWMMSVECGGAHRSWNYLPTPRNSREGDTFIWNKAGTFNTYQQDLWDHQIVQHGSHGREIKALALSPISDTLEERKNNNLCLVATGAEDTDIRLSRHIGCRSSDFGDATSSDIVVKSHYVSNGSVLRGHTTGIQHLMFSSCGQFLFSSGGAEEFYVWRLQKVPLLEIGAVLMAKLQKNREDLDARIMSFDIVRMTPQGAPKVEFTILLAYSNGKEKLVTFSCLNVRDEEEISTADMDDDDDGVSLDVVFEQSVGTLCLTQARMLSHETSRFGLTGATDGTLRLSKYSDLSVQVMSHRVHQSNVAAMAVCDFDSYLRLVVTGGDDNALGMTILSLASDVEKPFTSTTLVQDAHAAALTAVATMKIHGDTYKHSALIVSAGNDQKVRIWRVNIPREASPTDSAVDQVASVKQNVGGLELQMLREVWTDVADVSDVQIFDYVSEDSTLTAHPVLEVMVVGVGTQILKLLM